MQQSLPPVSEQYKKYLSSAVFSTVLFFISYFLLILFALALIVLLGYLAVLILSFKVFFLTIILALALVGTGLVVFYFLIKFIFSGPREIFSGMMEITEEEQPEVFRMIRTTVKETGTKMPKKVFISPDINASVSYNSVLLSLFFIDQKNLTIGLGLVNTTTVGELRSVLAHEFGHFSQRSMAVGSYVYQAEKIIYDTLYNNQHFEENLLDGSNHWGAKLAGAFAFAIIRGLQFFLKLISDFLFRNHASLRREMEFHADAVATSVTNPQEQISALLRLELSDSALGNALRFYIESDGKFQTVNVYENQTALLRLFSEQNFHKIENGLPKIDPEDIDRYSFGKISVDDVFASHPETKTRIKKILQNRSRNIAEDHAAARNLFRGYEAICEAVTKKLFIINNIKNKGESVSGERFLNLYKEKYPYHDYGSKYNGYYNNHNPVISDEILNAEPVAATFPELFSDEKAVLGHRIAALQNDIIAADYLSTKPKGLKTFRYGEQLCKITDAKNIVSKLNADMDELKKQTAEHDLKIAGYFFGKATSEQKYLLKEAYRDMQLANNELDYYEKVIADFTQHLQFMTVTLPMDEIRKKRHILLEQQKIFKKVLTEFLQKSVFRRYISEELSAQINNFMTSEFVYFEHEKYKDNEVETIGVLIQGLQNSLVDGYFKIKHRLLSTQLEIENGMVTDTGGEMAVI